MTNNRTHSPRIALAASSFRYGDKNWTYDNRTLDIRGVREALLFVPRNKR